MTRRITTLAVALVLGGAATPASAQGVPLGSPIPQRPLGKAMAEERGVVAFKANQLTFARVDAARKARDAELRVLFHERGIPYPAPEIFLRVFKHERVMELWVRARQDSAFTLLKEYPVCALPGQLGPKRRLGDVQVPEGFYFIDEFNPESAFHLSLRVSYPNLADRMRREALALGGDIFIHGGCETIGCVPIENHNIEEVYWLAVQAMDAGQKVIPVHIFPTRLEPGRLAWLEENFHPEPELLEFWGNLVDGYAFFEQTHRVPWVTVGQDGRYAVPERPAGPVLAGAVDAPARTAPKSAAATPPADSAGAPPAAARNATFAAAGGTAGTPAGTARRDTPTASSRADTGAPALPTGVVSPPRDTAATTADSAAAPADGAPAPADGAPAPLGRAAAPGAAPRVLVDPGKTTGAADTAAVPAAPAPAVPADSVGTDSVPADSVANDTTPPRPAPAGADSAGAKAPKGGPLGVPVDTAAAAAPAGGSGGPAAPRSRPWRRP